MVMNNVNKIMVAVDFSNYSLPAVRYASHLAKDVSASLLLTNVYNQREIDIMDRAARRYPIFNVKEYVGEKIVNRRKRIEDLIEKINTENLEVEINVCTGYPYEALLREIKEKKPDLLIMGIKGRSNLMGVVTGSCAQKMFRRSPIPLLILREQQTDQD
jgi:nucleotide-binding universal stress UspA family protein